MVETATARSFVERVREDISQRAEMLESDRAARLLRSQERWDGGKKIADRFSLKVKFEQVKAIIEQDFTDKSPVELVEAKRPEDFDSMNPFQNSICDE